METLDTSLRSQTVLCLTYESPVPSLFFFFCFFSSLSYFSSLFFNECISSSEAKPEVAMAMLRWAYTDELELCEDDTFLIDLMKLANRFQLYLLRERWAQRSEGG